MKRALLSFFVLLEGRAVGTTRLRKAKISGTAARGCLCFFCLGLSRDGCRLFHRSRKRVYSFNLAILITGLFIPPTFFQLFKATIFLFLNQFVKRIRHLWRLVIPVSPLMYFCHIKTIYRITTQKYYIP